jgi:ACS family tartrate transporter-like MFS transporter
LRGDAAAGGIALINATGNLGGFFGPYVMGWMKDATGDYLIGLRLLAAAAALSGAFVLVRGPAAPDVDAPRAAPADHFV